VASLSLAGARLALAGARLALISRSPVQGLAGRTVVLGLELGMG